MAAQACCILLPTLGFIGFRPPVTRVPARPPGPPHRCHALQSSSPSCSRPCVTALPCPLAVHLDARASGLDPGALLRRRDRRGCPAVADLDPPVTLMGFPSLERDRGPEGPVESDPGDARRRTCGRHRVVEHTDEPEDASVEGLFAPASCAARPEGRRPRLRPPNRGTSRTATSARRPAQGFPTRPDRGRDVWEGVRLLRSA